MTNRPQTIQIFLPDGSPTSIREAEITSRLVKAILFPRNKIQEVSRREMVRYTGVYFLFGPSEDGTKPIVYIGEGEDCFNRIQSHNREKDFWTHCVIVVSKTNDYNKADSKFLEHYCIKKAEEIGRYKLYNGTGSNKLSISESREHDLLDSFETAKILLATLGYPIFEEKRKATKSKEIMHCIAKNASADGELVDDGFLVYKGSKFSKEETKGINKWIKVLRKRLLDEEFLKEENDVYVLQTDYIFNSPSASAAAVLGRTANGWTSWKDKNGKTLDELKRKLND
ncbi:GIY-YIG nuclease family protein [uncultured Tenacibaculum sp.]|uniref:GIY-YIG nuclease family protein n=1 Tax=uncultured Tenacibaculum sp. TaxID=174713 RepID=UPI0026378F0B|nr:GIY-YIG nuclease family protein [uncultured Tenacibaculum sp.]